MSLHVNQSGTWTPVQKLHVHSGGAFVPVKKAFVNQGGTWLEYYTGEEEPPVGDPHPIFEHDNISVEYAMHWQDENDHIINTGENGNSDHYGIIELSGAIVSSDKFTKDFFTGTDGRIRINSFSPDLIGRTLNFWVKLDPLDTSIIHEVVKGTKLSIEYDPTVSPEVWRVKIETSVENTVEVEHTTNSGAWEMISVAFGNTDEVIRIWVGDALLTETAYIKSGADDQEITIGNTANCYVSRFRYFTAFLSTTTVGNLWNDGNGV